MLSEFHYHLQFLYDRIFFKPILANLVFLSRYQYVLNMDEALHCILCMVYA